MVDRATENQRMVGQESRRTVASFTSMVKTSLFYLIFYDFFFILSANVSSSINYRAFFFVKSYLIDAEANFQVS